MNIVFTKVDTSYACWELGAALVNVLPELQRRIIEKYSKRADERTLIVVLLCPCCNHDRNMNVANAVLVSPFTGIDYSKKIIHCASKYPPFRTPGQNGEAVTAEEYMSDFLNVVEKALG